MLVQEGSRVTEFNHQAPLVVVLLYVTNNGNTLQFLCMDPAKPNTKQFQLSINGITSIKPPKDYDINLTHTAYAIEEYDHNHEKKPKSTPHTPHSPTPHLSNKPDLQQQITELTAKQAATQLKVDLLTQELDTLKSIVIKMNDKLLDQLTTQQTAHTQQLFALAQGSK